MSTENQSLQKQLAMEHKKFQQLSEDSGRVVLRESTLSKENKELKASLDALSKEALDSQEGLQHQKQVL